MIVLEGIMMFSQYFSAFFSKDSEGELMLVTSKGAYFQLKGRIFMLTDASFGATPIGIGIEKVDFSTLLGLREGQMFRLKENALHLPGGVIRLKVQDADASLQLPPLHPELIHGCARMLQARCNPKGVSSLCAALMFPDSCAEPYSNPLCAIAHPLLTGLVNALTAGRPEIVESTVTQLIGMGIGLTPSLDDVILGMLYGLLRIAPEAVATQMLRDAVICCAPGRTNDISAAYLLAVADRAPFEKLDSILQGLAGATPLDIEPILEIGSSSGSEMLLGLLIAAKIIYL